MSSYKETVLINEEYLTSLLHDIHAAQQSIDLETYIFANDDVGKKVTDALCKAAKRGVKIRIVVDGIGTMDWGGKITEQLESCGINTKVFHPLPWKILHWQRAAPFSKFIFSKIFYLFLKINSRNHRKICIIDKSIVYIGSANISKHLEDSDDEKIWRETSVKIEGENISELENAFNKIWAVPLKTRLRWHKVINNSPFRLNNSWRRRHRFYKQLLNRIAKCEKRIWVTNAYFVPDSRLLKKLINASKKGLDVRIVLPSKTDVFIVSLASNTFYSTLLQHRINIYEYLPTILHSKVLILDDRYSIGSSNLNYRSFRHDLEVDVDIRTEEARSVIEKQFLMDICQSKQILMSDVKKQSIFKKIIGQFILLIRYWL